MRSSICTYTRALIPRNEPPWLHDLPLDFFLPLLGREIYWTTLCRGVGRRSMLHNALMKHDSLTQQDETFRSVTDTRCSSSTLSSSSIFFIHFDIACRDANEMFACQLKFIRRVISATNIDSTSVQSSLFSRTIERNLSF